LTTTNAGRAGALHRAFVMKTGAQLWIENKLAHFHKQKEGAGYYD
jgi:hypothetical protein